MHNSVEISAHTYVLFFKNKIDSLVKEQNNLFSDMEKIKFTAVDFFLSFFSPRQKLFNRLKVEVQLNNNSISEIGYIVEDLHKNKKDRIFVDSEYLSFLKDT